MFSSVFDFLNSAKDASREYERIRKEAFCLAVRCKKLEHTGQYQEIRTRYNIFHDKVHRVDDPKYDLDNLDSLRVRLEYARLFEVGALMNAVSRYRAVSEFIELLPYSAMRTIMRYRFLEDYTWREITAILSKDGWQIEDRYPQKLYKHAREAAQELWETIHCGNSQELKMETNFEEITGENYKGGELNDAADL